MTDALIVLTTLPDSLDASAWGHRLVEARLAACVSVLPGMRSVYRWTNDAGQDVIERAMEQQVMIKTTAARLDDLKTWLAANHPYAVPELLVLPVADGGSAYLAWIMASVE
ncbi:MAG: divalent-cation tolerance protein CutA [Vicinamibacterales bacterium]